MVPCRPYRMIPSIPPYLIAITNLFVALGVAAAGDMVIVVGAPGTEEYEAAFREAAAAWVRSASHLRIDAHCIGLDEPTTDDADRLRTVIATLSSSGNGTLWIVLIGHGTYYNEKANF